MNPKTNQFTSEALFRTEVLLREILPDLFVYRGAVNTGILKWGKSALLIDCDDSLTLARLAEMGITMVEGIYCTQHRRPNTAGIYTFLSASKQPGDASDLPASQPKVFAPQGERAHFETAAAYWLDWRNRWHLYHCRPGSQAPLNDIPIYDTVKEGDIIEWGGFFIQVLDTPGMTDGAVSYMVRANERTRKYRKYSSASSAVIFCGDVLYGPGQVWDLHSLQKNNGAWSDYHGFLGATKTLIASLAKLAETQADGLVPSHGDFMDNHSAAAQLTLQRLEQLYRNYAATSSLNFYFPHMFQELSEDPWRMKPSQTVDFPDFILPVAATSFAIKSESGALFLIDCGYDSVLETLNAWKEQGIYTQLEGCWVTHYHDDHVDSLHHLASMAIPISADEHMAEILAHPTRFFLPCISPAAAPVTHVTRDGETWRWHEFELTALHFPGQTLYHGGLLVRGQGMSVLFCGDSFAPTGLDDYTAGNRNFLGEGKGFRRCIDLVRQHRPNLILNQHQQQAFHFSDEQLDYMEKMLVEREALLAELLPWGHPNYGTDEGWVRAYPYEVEACAGGSCTVEIRATNHTEKPVALTVEAVAPANWKQNILNPETEPAELLPGEWIQQARVVISIPPGTQAGCYPVAFRVTWGIQYLGQVCHCLVKIW